MDGEHSPGSGLIEVRRESTKEFVLGHGSPRKGKEGKERGTRTTDVQHARVTNNFDRPEQSQLQAALPPEIS